MRTCVCIDGAFAVPEGPDNRIIAENLPEAPSSPPE